MCNSSPSMADLLQQQRPLLLTCIHACRKRLEAMTATVSQQGSMEEETEPNVVMARPPRMPHHIPHLRPPLPARPRARSPCVRCTALLLGLAHMTWDSPT